MKTITLPPRAADRSATDLTSETILQRAPGLSFDLDSGNCVRVFVAGQRVSCGIHGLAVLDAFAQPTRLSDALDQLRTRGRKDWIDLSATVVRLFRMGVLYDAAQATLCPD